MSTLDTVSDPFDELLEANPEAAAAELARLLAADTDTREAADSRAVQLLEDRLMGDGLLEHVDLRVLEALTRRVTDRQDPGNLRPDDERRWEAWSLLDTLRRSALLVRIAAADEVDLWADLILDLVEASNFTFGPLFEQRVAGYGAQTLFESGGSRITWHQAAGRVGLIARGLLALTAEDEGRPVAILSENSLEMALTDLACLTTGIVNVMIPATATDTEVGYILGHSKAGTVIVSGSTQLKKVHACRARLPELRRVVTVSAADADANTLAFDEVLRRATEVSAEEVGHRRAAVAIGDMATVMYTSGTTGRPKGIRFSQRNIVFKRFARALALPEIGDGDRLLSYLPLFHTFGRFLELCGSIFWGATYRFAESPNIDSLVREMRDYRPTVFISIPMKWMQLLDLIRRDVTLESDPDDVIAPVVERMTGGALRWGLSAAGYLDPEVFRFFQRYGVELMSGFGMTEATGGITMTQPGDYSEDSLGTPLPGIEAALADDGELIMRGPYVMMGYLDDPEGRPSFDDDGWFHSGDLMEQSADGHFHMVDRKKEIYKNVKGQTIAPQKVENLFRDFDSVARVFLVGDHRPFNTLLIYPNHEFEEEDLSALEPEELKAHFRSLVVSANTFLAPFERILDFAIIDRDFDPELGELTPKGTYRRKVIERNFADSIKLLYRRTTITVGKMPVTVPNWLFQAMGITSQELTVEGDELSLGSVGEPISIRAMEDSEVRVGSVHYRHSERVPLPLGLILSTPSLWLGNDEAVRFAPLDMEHRDRRRHRLTGLEWLHRDSTHHVTDEEIAAATEALASDEIGLLELHLASLLLNADHAEAGRTAVRILDRVLQQGEGELTGIVLKLLRHAAAGALPEVVREAFLVLIFTERPAQFSATLRAFVDAEPELFDDATAASLIEHELPPETIGALVSEAERRMSAGDPTAGSILGFLAEYGALHPARYRQLRAFLTRMAVTSDDPGDADRARRSLERLNDGFRTWLGPPSRIAIDPETGLEYRWDDVVGFDDEVDDEARRRIMAAIKSTTLVREGVFLFSHGISVRLDDILPGGIWVRHLGSGHGKSVFRVDIRTRNRGQYDLAVNLNRDLDERAVTEEIDWLVICAEDRDLGPLVEDYGGYWPEHGLWSEEFIPGETLDRSILRLSRPEPDRDRLEALWPFAAWSAMSAYVDFWNRTGRRLVVSKPSPGNVIVPTHDYHTGARLVSIADRSPFAGLPALLESLRRELISPVESAVPLLEGVVGWDVVFSSLLEIVGEHEGRELLSGVLEHALAEGREYAEELANYLEVVALRGFLPRRLFFAAKRFRTWDRLAPDATHTVRARTLRELYETYRLEDLRGTYPESRARFFRETVLRDAPDTLAAGLEEIITGLRRGDLPVEELSSAVADLRAHLDLPAEYDFFLARLSYPYLRPETDAVYVDAISSGVQRSEMVVTFEDPDGHPYRIRHALNPKEIARLHRLSLAARLPVQFRPEHRFLVAVSDRGHLLGGLYYEVETEAQTAHMDKVVVAESARGKGVASNLLEELFNRLRVEDYRWLTTGFFRPQFFYRFGFKVERRYAGLVRSLEHEDGE
ncbi:MAG: GNAT family N-acetyltransferase [Thermoanaerobaculales bacterium]|jgi:long-subunit acyl-CoA synthetase (AMP-forming)/GNAT superfamily N-acetyltransferase|nr:GNAT family N-acetyltransferase [Thermoanaerobaculales bacterium]